VKISVDAARCQGHTLCAMTAPQLFNLDEADGHAIVVATDGVVSLELRDEARRAFANCPEQAITLDDGGVEVSNRPKRVSGDPSAF
jgi:ferredoxin